MHMLTKDAKDAKDAKDTNGKRRGGRTPKRYSFPHPLIRRQGIYCPKCCDRSLRAEAASAFWLEWTWRRGTMPLYICTDVCARFDFRAFPVPWGGEGRGVLHPVWVTVRPPYQHHNPKAIHQGVYAIEHTRDQRTDTPSRYRHPGNC